MNWWDKLKTWAYGAGAAGGNASATDSVPAGFTSGVLLDTRPATVAQAEDVRFGEIVATAAVVQWIVKAASNWRSFPVFNQSSTGACVAFTMAKLLGILRWQLDGLFITFSPGDIYRRRINQGTQGMNTTDPFSISARGVTLDAVEPSQNLTEAQINNLKVPDYATSIAGLFKLCSPKAIILTPGDIDSVASVMQQTGKGVMLWFYFTSNGNEWSANPTSDSGVSFTIPQVQSPSLGQSDAAAARHSVTAVDFTMYNGQKAIVVEDSAWFGGLMRRVITEDFFKARNFFAAYPMNLQKTAATTALPRYTFAKPLVFIPWDDSKNQPADVTTNNAQLADVTALQRILQVMTDVNGNTYFPTNVTCSGYYGALTSEAVYKWQTDHAVAPQAELDSLAGQGFGAASIAEMNAEVNTI